MYNKLKDHYDVGIYGWWGHDNFGGCLTYYALNKSISKMGYSVVMLQEANGLPVRYNIPDDCIAMQFMRKNCDCTKQLNVLDLPSYNDLCDTFIVGGDQMWSFYINMVKEDNFLNFVSNEKVKLSYSTSFGPNNFNPPRWFVDMAKPLLQRFDAVSVREDYAVALAKEIYDVNATQVIDAVFLLEKNDFIKAAEDSNYNFPENFLFAFILNPTREKRRQVERIAKKLGLDVVCAPDAAVGYHKSFYETFAGLKVIDPLNVSNFLKAYEKASYVVTDSFHGTCFSYIYKKNFSVYFNEQRGADRFVALMKLLELDERRIFEKQSDEELINNANIDFNVDWKKADENIERERKVSWNWLLNALNKGVEDRKNGKSNKKLTVDAFSKNLCTGCSACYNVCPVNAISMIEDAQGFYEPSIDKSKCINCGRCEKTCPVLHQNRKNSRVPECYAVMNDNAIRKDSSSGGVFSALADFVLSNGGYVCGAGYDSNFVVGHTIVSNDEGVKALRRSKYVMSKVGDCYRRIKTLLNNDKIVLFTGCPCQVGGLKNYLGRNYDNLILVDIVCHGAPSNKMFQKYIAETYGVNNLKEFYFRTKEFGWTSFTQIAVTNDGVRHDRDYSFDYFEKTMHSGLGAKDCCLNCIFAPAPRQGDLTIGDFWGISKHDKNLNDGLGTSVLLVNNENGKRVLSSIIKKLKTIVPVPYDFAKVNNRFMQKIGAPNGRRWFFTMIKDQPFEKSAKYALRRKFDIGLIGLWYSRNYGNMASYYALHYVLTEKLSRSVLTVENCLRQDGNLDMSKTSPRTFASKYYDISIKYNPDDLIRLNDHCDTFVIGDDQMWNIELSRPYKLAYFLGFADSDKRKISYGTSFGKKYAGSSQEKMISAHLLNEFDSLSVGDDLSENIAKKDFGIKNVTKVCNPALLCPEKEFVKLADKASLYIKDKYILAYIVDPNPEIGQNLLRIAERFNCKIFVVLNNDPDRWEENKNRLALNNAHNVVVKPTADLYEWLWYYNNAYAVISDSYYGVVFSIVFKKPFIAKVNAEIGKDRFLSLLAPLGIENVLCDDHVDLIGKVDMINHFDYEEINKKLDPIVSTSYEWLKKAVQFGKYVSE